MKRVRVLAEGRASTPRYYEPVTSRGAGAGAVGRPRSGDAAELGRDGVKHLPNARHIVVPGTGHGAITPAAASASRASSSTSGSVDGLDTSVPAAVKRPPFFLTPAGPDPARRAAIGRAGDRHDPRRELRKRIRRRSTAVDGVSFTAPDGRGHGPARPERRRQDDDAAHAVRADAARRGHASTSTASTRSPHPQDAQAQLGVLPDVSGPVPAADARASTSSTTASCRGSSASALEERDERLLQRST